MMNVGNLKILINKLESIKNGSVDFGNGITNFDFRMELYSMSSHPEAGCLSCVIQRIAGYTGYTEFYAVEAIMDFLEIDEEMAVELYGGEMTDAELEALGIDDAIIVLKGLLEKNEVNWSNLI